LPVPRPSIDAADDAARAAPAERVSRTRVLIVEDDEGCAGALRDLLQHLGYEAVVACDGVAGLAAASTLDPDVVVCDVNLPGLDGYEVARRLRAGGTRARLVAHTSCARHADVDQARRAGFDAHVAKPADPVRLAAAILPRHGRVARPRASAAQRTLPWA
jgi:CheY-like chemotaxis protein